MTAVRWAVQDSKARPCRRRGKKQSSGLFFSAWLVASRNVYRDDSRLVVGGTGLEQGGSDDASRQSKRSVQCNDDDRCLRQKQGGVVGAAF